MEGLCSAILDPCQRCATSRGLLRLYTSAFVILFKVFRGVYVGCQLGFCLHILASRWRGHCVAAIYLFPFGFPNACAASRQKGSVAGSDLLESPRTFVIYLRSVCQDL